MVEDSDIPFEVNSNIIKELVFSCHFWTTLLWIITLCNISENEASINGLYDYWQYGQNRLIVLGVIMGFMIILCCCIPICSDCNNGLSENDKLCLKVLLYICKNSFISITLIFTYYLISINNNAMNFKFNPIGSTYLDMIQIVTFITIILDYVITMIIAIYCCQICCMCECFCFYDDHPITLCCKAFFNLIKNSFIFQKIKEFCKCNITCSCVFTCGNGIIEPSVSENSQVVINIENDSVPPPTNVELTNTETETAVASTETVSQPITKETITKECPICCNLLDNDHTQLEECKHVFCTACINKWEERMKTKKQNPTCPCCRNNF